MSFDFYTLGGSQFWEDVFYYQKWRIQRNYKTKKYRLLDNWDIRRAEGSFNACRRAFLKYIEVFQLSRQKGHMVIMLHGLADSKNVFKPLWRALTQNGLLAAAINYPSTRKRIDGHVRQLDFFMGHLEDIHEVSFVTKGIGGLILNKTLALNSPWQQKIKINRISEINPPQKNCVFFECLAKFRLFNYILGPILKDLKANNIQSLTFELNKNQTGVVQYASWIMKLFELLPQSISKYLPQFDNIKRDQVKDVIRIDAFPLNPLKNTDVVTACLKFLAKGRFH